MDLLQPRAVYRRANTDERASLTIDNTELHSIRSIQSFSSFNADQAPLLEYGPDHQNYASPRPSLLFTLKSTIARFVPQQLYGWKLGALAAGILAGVSLLINIIAAVWLGSHKQGSGLVEVYKGDCDRVTDIDLWSHLAINVLSTLLLGGSNYCMQCLCAPTRADIDRAHQRWSFLDIGVPSVRNLRGIPAFRSVLWWILALSSIPLHLMYNSAFYKSLSMNDYNIVLATEDLLDGILRYNQTWQTSSDWHQTINLTDLSTNVSTATGHHYEKLDISACVDAYATAFPSERRNLVFVLSNSSNHTSNFTVVDIAKYAYDLGTIGYYYDAKSNTYQSAWATFYGTSGPYNWICESDSRIGYKIDIPHTNDGSSKPCSTYAKHIAALGDRWQPFNYDVQYCLSELVPQSCSYSGNIPIVAIVIVCNIIKMVCMFIVAFRLRPGSLITIGDAIASFLGKPDLCTKDECLLSRDEAIKAQNQKRLNDKAAASEPRTARIQPQKWASSASWLRWIYTTSLLIIALIVSSALLNLAVKSISQQGLDPLSFEMGAVDPAAIISGWAVGFNSGASKQILTSILIANTPQVIFSFLYLNLNGLLTTMWMAAEWSDFATERKALRTSKPKGQQRSTHFLQLPYRISIPLMICSGVLHWLISQSLFLAVVSEYNFRGELGSPVAIASCGYSPIAMIIVIALGFALILATLALGQRKYNGSIPLVGSCSLAISASCHRPDWDVDAALKPVLWGVIPASDVLAGGKNVGHCSFTSGEVEPLIDGKEYAGHVAAG